MTFKNAKYEATGETKEWFGRTLHRIRAVADIDAIGLAAGTLGGWIEKPDNLSDRGPGWVYPSAIVCGGGNIWGGNIKNDGDHGAFCTVGSEGGTLSWNFCDDGKIIVNRGCFNGTLDEFAAAVEKRHGDSQHGQEYRLLIEFIRLRSRAAIDAMPREVVAAA